MATITSFRGQCKDRDPDYKGLVKRRFRWGKLRFEWGRWCEVIHPVQGVRDYYWWEWENK